MSDHEHQFTKLRVRPSKMYFCAIPGCKAEAAVDPKTKGPDLSKAGAPKAVEPVKEGVPVQK